MQTALLQTKFHIPSTRPAQVSRPRLIEQLNVRLHRKLTLISAPAGFGKTTLVSEWIQLARKTTPTITIAWLSLDESDNDASRFLTYVITALQTVGPDVGQGALSAIQAPQPPPVEVLLTELINEIAAISNKIVLVLDDYHLIEARPIHDALTFLIQHLPPQMHLVITTREDPPLPLARLRARGQLNELRAIDLRFTETEAAEFLTRVMKLNLTGEDVAALATRTEGWIAGLQLAALALQGPASMQGLRDITGFIESFTGSHRYVLDYLIEEVLEQQTQSIQDFLLRTSVLDRLNGSLCDAVLFSDTDERTRKEDAQVILETLDRANLFIVPLDEERQWYRYHHLFADLLRQRLQQTYPAQIPTLLIRASLWHEQNGFIDKAIEYAMRAKDFEQAIRLIDSIAEVVWARGDDAKLRRWLDALPTDAIRANPQLCIYHAWSVFITGDMDEADQLLTTVERQLDPDVTSRDVAQLRGDVYEMLAGRAATVRAFMCIFQGDMPGVIRHAQYALEMLPKDDLAWRSTAANTLADAYDFSGEIIVGYEAKLRSLETSEAAGNDYQILIAHLKLALLQRQRGQLQQVIDICQRQWQSANDKGLAQSPITGWLLAVWGEVLAEINELDAALQKAKMGVELAEHGGDMAVLGWSYLCLVRILFTLGDFDEVEAILEKAAHIAREKYVPLWITNPASVWQVRIWLAQGKLDNAAWWIQEHKLAIGDDYAYSDEVTYIAFARILIAQGQLDNAIRLLRRVREESEAAGRTTKAIEVTILQALAFQAGGDTDQALDALECGLNLAQPGGFVRIFVDEGAPMARLLYDAYNRGTSPAYVQRLLSAFPATEPSQKGHSETDTANAQLIEPLSERELEVLQLVATGLSNREIASKLYVSLNTIKGHTRHIYGKLGVKSRTQASARARALGILPP